MSCTNGRTWTSLGVCLLMAIQAGMETAVAEEGVFVAVGYGGRRMVSKDGKTWEITAEWAVNGADDSNNLMSIAHGNGRFVAVGGGGWTRETQAGHILVSTDGKTWKETLKLANRVNPVIFGNGQFVTSGPPDKTLYSSADGETWQAGAKVPFEGWALWFRQGAYGNGTFVMMGECMPKKEKYWVVATPDGKTISHFSTDLPHLRSLAFGGETFVAVGHGGVVVTSKDGKNWEKGTVGSDEKLEWLLWTGKEFICGGGKKSFASADGITWKSHPLQPKGRPLWTDGTRYLSTSWPGKMYYSPDGKTWENAPEMTANGINRIVFGPLK